MRSVRVGGRDSLLPESFPTLGVSRLLLISPGRSPQVCVGGEGGGGGGGDGGGNGADDHSGM